jgi:glycosyltransferase involved in cell wall biosynthesis
VEVSVVVCTHNRSRLLREALGHLIAQDLGSAKTEVIVIDNNSTDDTAEVVHRLARSAPVEVRYSFEERQGISYARNRAWKLARGTIVAFTDDDVCVSRDWVARIVEAFAEHADVDCVGGRVLPAWPVRPPPWLTSRHYAPLAVLDYGDAPLQLDHDNPKCLVGANFAFRHRVLARLGGFSAAVQRVRDGIGSIEDHEFLIRLWDSGGRALYVPGIVAVSPVDPVRLEKRYHRRWHFGHGHFHAIMRTPSMEQSHAGRVLGVPAHLYRQLLQDSVAWTACAACRRWDDAFDHEVRIRFFGGFFHTRRREYLARTRQRLASTFWRRTAAGAS